MRFHIPIRLPSLANQSHMHWRRLAREANYHKASTKVTMRDLELPPPPVLVTITRVGPRRLDDDNLAASCKYVRDEIARAFGVDDGSDKYTWRYEQAKGEYGVDVEVVAK